MDEKTCPNCQSDAELVSDGGRDYLQCLGECGQTFRLDEDGARPDHKRINSSETETGAAAETSDETGRSSAGVPTSPPPDPEPAEQEPDDPDGIDIGINFEDD